MAAANDQRPAEHDLRAAAADPQEANWRRFPEHAGETHGADAPMTTGTRDRRRSVPVLALSPDEAAAALGVSRDYLDEHVAHELRWVRRGRRKFVAVRELERWLATAAEMTLP